MIESYSMKIGIEWAMQTSDFYHRPFYAIKCLVSVVIHKQVFRRTNSSGTHLLSACFVRRMTR